MGYRLANRPRSTSQNWSKSTAATGAASTGFAPVLQLLQSLIGKREAEHWSSAIARAAPHSDGTTSGWRLRLAEHGARLLTTARIDR
jgi:hypothetical protein